MVDELSEFETFVSAQQQSLLRAAFLLTQDRGHAEDLLQDTLLKVYRRWRREGSPTHSNAYVRRVLVNEFISSRRRRKWTEVPADIEDRSGPGGEMNDRVMVWHALSTLAPRQRAVLVLRVYEGLSDAEIAEYLGCAEGTVRSLASRAYQSLRENCGLLDRRPVEGGVGDERRR